MDEDVPFPNQTFLTDTLEINFCFLVIVMFGLDKASRSLNELSTPPTHQQHPLTTFKATSDKKK
jgi:hypothetical protein